MSLSKTYRGRGARALAAAVCLLAVSAPPAFAENTVFTIDDERIVESSGLAADVDNDVVWTVNDDAPGRAFALDEKGKVSAVLDFGADIVDVEAVARAGDRLYIGDIGDNKAKRKFVTVISILNPKPVTSKVRYRAWDFVYPKGKAHNAEALLVNEAGQVFIVTKEAKGAIYTFDGVPSPQGTNKLTKVGDAPSFVTDGTFLPDGRMVLRTYVGLYVLNADYEVAASAPLPYQPQGESVTTSLVDVDSLWVGSEGKKSKVLSVPIPTKKTEAPKASEKPPTKAKASPTPAPEESSQDASGTGWAFLIAAVAAVIAAAATALIGRGSGGPPPGIGSAEGAKATGGLKRVRSEGRTTWSEEEPAGGEPEVKDDPADAWPDRPAYGEDDRRRDLGWLYDEKD